MMSGACSRREAGFTLLEVMVAIAILALVVSGIMQVFTQSLKGIGRSELYTEGVLVAREIIEEALLDSTLQPGESSGVENDVFEWRMEVIPRDIASETEVMAADQSLPSLPIEWLEESSPLHLYEIRVEVTWPSTGYPGRVKLSTLSARVEPDFEGEES